MFLKPALATGTATTACALVFGACSLLFDVESADDVPNIADAAVPSRDAFILFDAAQSGRYDAGSSSCAPGFAFDPEPISVLDTTKVSYSHMEPHTFVSMTFEGPENVVVTGPEVVSHPTLFIWAYGIDISEAGTYRATFSGMLDGGTHTAFCDFEVTDG